MIGVVDSGSGGLSVLKEMTRLLPGEKYLYYSDNAWCPYGEKTRDFIIERMRAVTDFLLGKGADIIVVACNTATSAAISTLREEYSDESSEQCRERVLRLTGGRRRTLYIRSRLNERKGALLWKTFLTALPR